MSVPATLTAQLYAERRERFAEIEATLARLVREEGVPDGDPNLLLRRRSKRCQRIRALCREWLALHRAHWWP